MAYGIKYAKGPHRFTLISRQIGNCSKSVTYDYTDVEWSRSGTNSPKQLKPKRLPIAPSTRKVCFWRKIPVGLKKSGKVRYIRDHICVWKTYYPKGCRKRQKKLRRKYIKPNQLRFWKASIRSSFTGAMTGKHPSYPGWGPRIIEGNAAGGLRIPYVDLCWQGQSDQTYQPGTYLVDPLSLATGYLPTIRAKALEKLYSKLKGSDINLAVALAEANKTLAMIGESASRLARCLINVKRGNITGALTALGLNSRKGIANNELLIQYGIRPLMSDIDGLARHLAERGFRNETFQVSAASGRFGLSADQYRLHSSDFSGRSDLFDRYDVIVKYVATVSIQNALEYEASQLGFLSLRELTWELIPLSFVLDWFIPIGNYFSNVDSLASLRVEQVHETVLVRRAVSSVTRPSGTDSSGIKWTGTPSGWTVVSLGVSRTPLDLIPDLPFPTFRNPLSTEHIANAVSLFTQLKK